MEDYQKHVVTEESVGPYEGGDIVGHIMKTGFELLPSYGAIQTIPKIRDGAIVVTTYAVFHF